MDDRAIVVAGARVSGVPNRSVNQARTPGKGMPWLVSPGLAGTSLQVLTVVLGWRHAVQTKEMGPNQPGDAKGESD